MNDALIEAEKKSEVFNRLLEDIASTPRAHDLHSIEYQQLAMQTRKEIECLFSGNEPVNVEPFGRIIFPLYQMGATDSMDLWGIDELILFSFYYNNRDRYKRTVDIGANIGLHSIIMSRCGFKVTAYEPDPIHCDILMKNLNLNGCEASVAVEGAAVSDRDGSDEFVRVIGNTMSSHLAREKNSVHTPTERFSVRTVNIADVVKSVDLIKINAEGHEGVIIDGIPDDAFKYVDIVMKVSSKENAERIYTRMKELGANLFAQGQAWDRVTGLKQMATSSQDGSLFISCKEEMPWKESSGQGKCLSFDKKLYFSG